MTDNQKQQEIYKSFHKEWPISRLQQMRIDEYTNLDKTSFCYWLEAITEPLGSIWGGSSYKFGIYKRRNTDRELNRNGYLSDGVYSWLQKYGNTSDEAFSKTKEIIISVAEAATKGTYDDIDRADLGFAYKWKIGFLYSDLKLINLFNENAVRKVAHYFKFDNAWKAPVSSLQSFLKGQQSHSEDTWEFGGRLWQIFQDSNVVKETERTFYKYSAGSNASRWEEDQQLGIIAINFGKLNTGSLSQYASHEELGIALGVDYKNSNNSWNLWLFKEAKIGDVIIANNGVNIVLGFGIIKGPYEYSEEETEFKHRRKVDWIANKEWKYTANTIPNYSELLRRDTFSTTKIHKEIVSLYLKAYPEYILEFKKYGMQPEKIGTPTNDPPAIPPIVHPLNQILYGPPGTGKTFCTSKIAFEIINSFEPVDNEAASVFFKEELQKPELTRRVEFITFHQNYSYEDFLIGIRPNINNSSALTFNRYEGVFYRVCQRAKENWLKSQVAKEYEPTFQEVFDEYFSELYEKGESKVVQMKDPKYKFKIELRDGALSIITSGGNSTNNIVESTLRDLYEGTRSLKGGLNSYYGPLVTELKTIAKGMSKKAQPENRENFVLIIDEINRANISRVFGELITLIEEDKRLGKPQHIKLQLPNGEFFEVPDNLYIVGTMNTADKSIALIDIALRRRFEFIAYYPDYEILKLDYSHHVDLLKAINKEIYEKKKTADYLIGHAYFMKKDTVENILIKKIIPLLMEYFSGKVDEVKSIFKATQYNVTYDNVNFRWQITLRDTTNG